MRLEANVMIEGSIKILWKKISMELDKSTTIVEAQDPDHCVVLSNGNQLTIDRPYKEIDKVIKHLIGTV